MTYWLRYGVVRPAAVLLAFVTAQLACGVAKAGPLEDCSALLPAGKAPVYVVAPPRHTEICHAPAFVLSHDDTAHEPRWVAWVVTADHLKMPHIARTNDFRADPALPAGAAARPADYARSGFDQGHMADAEDNSWSAETEHDSFLLSNMIPQCGPCNRATWRYLENWTRDQAMRLGSVFVISGPVFDPSPAAIGPDHVWVPKASWRWVVSGSQTWAFIVPNTASELSPGTDVTPYRVTREVVEQETGIRLPGP